MKEGVHKELKIISARLLSLYSEIQKLTDAIRDQQERESQRAESQHTPPAIPPTLRAELQIPEHTETERKSDSKKQHRQQVWLTWGTWLAFLAASVYAGIAYSQRSAMITANTISKDALESVQRGLIICREPTQVRTMFYTKTGSYGITEFGVPCTNTGNTAANIISRFASSERIGVGKFDVQKNKFLGTPTNQTAIIGPKGERTFGARNFEKPDVELFGKVIPGSADEIRRMKFESGGYRDPLGFWGWIVYRDVFPDTPMHLTEYCYVMVKTGIVQSPQNPIVHYYVPCLEHNCVDQYCGEYEDIMAMTQKK